MDPMILSVLYVWCQLNKDMVVQFWFGTRFKVSNGTHVSNGTQINRGKFWAKYYCIRQDLIKYWIRNSSISTVDPDKTPKRAV